MFFKSISFYLAKRNQKNAWQTNDSRDMSIDTTYRSKDIEIMDDLDMSGDLLIKTLDQIAGINKWLGGNKITINGIETLLQNHPKSKEIVVLDIGCGDGEILRKCSDFATKKGYTIKCIGIDFNQNIIDYAQQKNSDYLNLEFKKGQIKKHGLGKMKK